MKTKEALLIALAYGLLGALLIALADSVLGLLLDWVPWPQPTLGGFR